MRKNNKGFVITEVLILSTVIIGLLVFMYIQFRNINRSYQYSFSYDTVEGMYLANNIVNYINEKEYDNLVDKLNSSQEGYLDITYCNVLKFNTSSYCETLFDASKVEQVLFTEENLTKLKSNMNNLSEDMKEYINQIQTINSKNDYRIIIKYQNKTFTTMRFNKENSYVQEGLIAYLDGVNNTGSGHSSNTTIWKDLSNNENDATLYNNPTWSNNSLTFDGLSNYARLENTANMPFTDGITWEVRLKVLSLTGLKENGNMNLFGAWLEGGGGIFFSNTNAIRSNLYINGTYIVCENTTLNSIGQYYTVVITYDNENMKQYINGELVSTKQQKGEIKSSIAPLTLGADQRSSYGNVEFQNILIYNRPLSESEVLRNYQVDKARY